MSKRFNDKCNLDDMNSFNFVSASSTIGEKILKTRAALVNNDQGVKINGRELAAPSSEFMKRLDIQEKLLENQSSVERLNRRENTFSSPLTSNIKFEMRYQKQV